MKQTKQVNKTATEVWLENQSQIHRLSAQMFMDKACVWLPEDVKEVWIFRGSEHYKFSLPSTPIKRKKNNK